VAIIIVSWLWRGRLGQTRPPAAVATVVGDGDATGHTRQDDRRGRSALGTNRTNSDHPAIKNEALFTLSRPKTNHRPRKRSCLFSFFSSRILRARSRDGRAPLPLAADGQMAPSAFPSVALRFRLLLHSGDPSP
jgi:hypothetical protein